MPRKAKPRPLTAAQRRFADANRGLIWFAAGRFAHRFPECSRLLGEDAISIAGLALMRAAKGFDPKRGVQFSTYVCKAVWVALGCALSAAQHRAALERQTDWPDSEPLAPEPREGAQPEHLEALHQAIQRLPRRYRTMFVARFIEERQLDEIGLEHGVSKERVRQICDKALAKVGVWVLRSVRGGRDAA